MAGARQATGSIVARAGLGASLIIVLVASGAHAQGEPAPTLPVPSGAALGGPSQDLSTMDAPTRAAYAGVGLLDYGSACSTVLIRPDVGPPPASAPAYALTNGHCVNLFDTSTVVQDVPVGQDEAKVRFGSDEAGRPVVEAAVTAVRWATMKGTDLAIVQLADPLTDLLERGLQAYPLAAHPDAGTPVVVVGGPTPIDGSERVLRLASCTAGEPADLLERHWAWFGFPSNDCADILPGSSGSPVLDPATGTLVGLINTTTQGSNEVSDCALGRPCEVGAAGAISREDTSYGPTVDVLTGCFDKAWTFTGPGGTCALDPGKGVLAASWVTSANPGATTLSGGFVSPDTWDAELTGTKGIHWMRTAVGPAGQVDCHDPTIYGAPRRIPANGRYDAALPVESGHWLLCVIGGQNRKPGPRWQSTMFPTVLHTDIDRTPPIPAVVLSVREEADGWLVEPIFRAPELSQFDWKWGPEDATDCTDATGYAPYRRFPELLPFEDAPTRVCVVGYDDANNAAPTLDQVFSRTE